MIVAALIGEDSEKPPPLEVVFYYTVLSLVLYAI